MNPYLSILQDVVHQHYSPPGVQQLLHIWVQVEGYLLVLIYPTQLWEYKHTIEHFSSSFCLLAIFINAMSIHIFLILYLWPNYLCALVIPLDFPWK